MSGSVEGGQDGVLNLIEILNPSGCVNDYIRANLVGAKVPNLLGIRKIPLELFHQYLRPVLYSVLITRKGR